MTVKIKTCKASNGMVKSSVQKVNEVCSIIRGKKALEAVFQMEFCKRSVSNVILKLLNSALANAQNNYSYNINNMYIKTIMVGKSISLKRSSPRGRGKTNKIVKPYSKIIIILEERKI